MTVWCIRGMCEFSCVSVSGTVACGKFRDWQMLLQYSVGYLWWHLNTLVDTGDNIYNKFVRHNTVTSVDEQLKEPGFLVRKESHMVQQQHPLVPIWDTRSSDTADFGDHMFASWQLAARLMSLQRSLYIYLDRGGLASLAP